MDNRAKEIADALRIHFNSIYGSYCRNLMCKAVELIETQAAEIERLEAQKGPKPET